MLSKLYQYMLQTHSDLHKSYTCELYNNTCLGTLTQLGGYSKTSRLGELENKQASEISFMMQKLFLYTSQILNAVVDILNSYI